MGNAGLFFFFLNIELVVEYNLFVWIVLCNSRILLIEIVCFINGMEFMSGLLTVWFFWIQFLEQSGWLDSAISDWFIIISEGPLLSSIYSDLVSL